MYILTRELVDRALDWVRPAVDAILADKETTWGPQYVSIQVFGPGLNKPIMDRMGKKEAWQSDWGEERDFFPVAKKKLEQALRNGEPTSITVSQRPWAVFPGEYFYPGGVAVKGLGVGVSGALGITDEEVAWMIFHALVLACRLKAREMDEEGIRQLPSE